MLLNIYFPNSWWELGILFLSLIVIPFIIKGLLWAGGKKQEVHFMIPFLVLLVAVLIWFLIAKTIPWVASIEFPDWMTTWWFLLAVIVLLLSIIFRKRIFTKALLPTPSKNGWWTKFIFWSLFVAFTIWMWTPLTHSIRDWWGNRNKSTYTSTSGTSSNNPSSKRSSYRAFMLKEDNAMKAGVWYTFTQGDGPLLRFQPKEPNTTIVYKIVMFENATRNWKVEVWTDPTGKVFENRLNPNGIEPNNAAKRGLSRIMIDKDAIVVSTKGK